MTDQKTQSESAKSSLGQPVGSVIQARSGVSLPPTLTSTTRASTSSTSIPATEAGLEPSAPITKALAIPTEPIADTPFESFGFGFGKTKAYLPSSKDSLIKTYQEKTEERRRLRARSFPFISEHFHPDFRLCQGLVVVGATTGQSKSTTNANILAAFLGLCPRHKALAITNEEPMDTVYNRVACIRLGLSFNRFHTGFLSEETCQRVEAEAQTLMERIEVVCSGEYDMTYLEDVQSVLDYAATKPDDIGLVTLDYMQTVASQRMNRMASPYETHKKLGLYLKAYGTKLGAPVVCFVQLKEKGQNAFSFKSRIEGDSHFLNHAFDGIEAVPNFKDKTTTFVIHKSRFGIPQGSESVAEFKDGQLIFRPENERF